MPSLLQDQRVNVRTREPFGRGAVKASHGGSGCVSDGERWRMRFVYLLMSVLPTLALVTVAAYVIRAISVRIVWR